MKTRILLEKILNINPKLAPKYKEITERWWSEPEEHFMIAEFGSRVYMGVSILSWAVSSFAIVFSLISFLSKNYVALYSWIGVSILFGIIGFIILNSSNQQKKIYMQEKEKYQKAKENKPIVDRRMVTYFRATEKTIIEYLYSELKKEQELHKLEDVIDELITIIQDAEHVLREIYRTNKVYDYNINESLEIEAYSMVDSYKKYEELSLKLDKYLRQLYDAKKFLHEGSDRELLTVIENILQVTPEELNQDEEKEYIEMRAEYQKGK